MFPAHSAFALNLSAPYGLETHLGWLDTPQGTTGPLERCYLVPAPAWHGIFFAFLAGTVCKGSKDVGYSNRRPWQMLVCGYRSGQTSRRPLQPLTRRLWTGGYVSLRPLRFCPQESFWKSDVTFRQTALVDKGNMCPGDIILLSHRYPSFPLA